MMRRFLLWFTANCLKAPRVIWDRAGGTPYLSRWYPFRSEAPQEHPDLPGQASKSEEENPRKHPDLFIHRFHRSDDDDALHNHPFEWSLSFVLVGGYWEERRVGEAIVRRRIKPFRFNFIRSSDYHRVDLVEEDAWTLFLVGPRVDTWYFWDRVLRARMQWEAFIRWKRGKAPPEWEYDACVCGGDRYSGRVDCYRCDPLTPD